MGRILPVDFIKFIDRIRSWD